MRGGRRGSPRRVQPVTRDTLAGYGACGRKRQYRTAEEAMAHALLLPPAAREGLEAYSCEECGGMFHLGHRRKGK